MYITATGMVCAVGLNAASACAAMRAGIANFVELPYLDNHLKPFVGAPIAILDEGFRRDERLIEMLSKVVASCLQETKTPVSPELPIIVGLAERGRPGGSDELRGSVIDRLQAKTKYQFHSDLSIVMQVGHTAAFRLLDIVRRIFQDSEVSACLVCGADSLINHRTLRWLEQHWRVKTSENSDGIIPGEAAAAVLIQRNKISGGQILLEVTGLGFGHETAHVLSEEPLLGKGLASAVQAALSEANLGMHEIDLRLSDATGEAYGFKEQVLTLARLMRVRKAELPIWHCADSIGDVGAASGVCQLVQAFHAFQKQYAPGNQVICTTTGVLGDRAVAVVRANPD